MNGKQAKKLRRAALGLGVALNEAGKDIKKDGYVVKKHEASRFSASSIMSDHIADPEEQKPLAPPTYQLFVRPDSVKSIYKKLKTGRLGQ